MSIERIRALEHQVELLVRATHRLMNLTADDSKGPCYLSARYIESRDRAHAEASAALSYNPKF